MTDSLLEQQEVLFDSYRPRSVLLATRAVRGDKTNL